MKKIIYLIILIILAFIAIGITFGQVYIDPSFTGMPNGTINAPYKAFPTFQANTIYYIKSGTTLTLNSTLVIDADNVTITSYGDGAKPVIYNPEPTRRTITVRTNNVKFKNICSKMPKAPSYDAGEWNIMFYNSNNKNISGVIDNCDIIGGNPAVHSFKSTSVRVLNSTITKACYDSYYGEFVDTVIFKNCIIKDMDWDANDLSQDLIHIKHAKEIIIDNCILDHNFPGKYCIIAHQDNAGFDNTKLTVTNTKFIASDETEACVKASVPYNSFTNCIFNGGKRSMQDVWNNLMVNNCLFISNNLNMIQGIPWCDYPVIKNSTFVGLNNPYLGQINPVNTIFWNCNGGGANWKNSATDPKFDTNYTATGQLTSVGYIGNWVITPPVEPPVELPTDNIAQLLKQIEDLQIKLGQITSQYDSLKVEWDNVQLIINIVKSNKKVTEQKVLLQECYNVFLKSTINSSLKLEIRTKILPFIQ